MKWCNLRQKFILHIRPFGLSTFPGQGIFRKARTSVPLSFILWFSELIQNRPHYFFLFLLSWEQNAKKPGNGQRAIFLKYSEHLVWGVLKWAMSYGVCLLSVRSSDVYSGLLQTSRALVRFPNSQEGRGTWQAEHPLFQNSYYAIP